MTLAFDALDAPTSPMSRLDPRWKLAGLVPAVAAVASLHRLEPLVAACTASLSLLLAARLPRRLVLMRLGGFLLFLAPFVAWIPLWEGRSGWSTALELLLRAVSVVVLGLVLVATATVNDQLKAADSIGIPTLLTRIAMLSYRSVFVFADELARIRVAIRVRGFRNRFDGHSYRTVGHLIGGMFSRGLERSERIHQAMICRGYDGRSRSLHSFATRTRDVLFAVGCIMASLGLVVWDRCS